jgi:hypothetical protein
MEGCVVHYRQKLGNRQLLVLFGATNVRQR